MSLPLVSGKFQALDANGVCPGAELETYAAGTLNGLATFSDPALTAENTNPIICDATGHADVFLTPGVAYRLRLYTSTASGRTLIYDRDNVIDQDALTQVSASDHVDQGAGLVGLNPALPYLAGTMGAYARSKVDVKDFGAIGTANPSNEAADTLAFSLAKAAGKQIRVPEGSFYLSATFSLDPGYSLVGAGTGKTVIFYSGAGNAIYMGAPGNISLAYDCALRGITLVCTNRATTVNGVYGENLVYFTLDDVTSIGSGDPNSSTPANRVLYGAGFLLTNNSIIGRITRCSARVWNYGLHLKTLPGSASFWTAAIEISGHGEYANNMWGMVFGDASVAFTTASGVTVRGVTIQGNYSGGVAINAGNSLTLEGVYFEGNANYDVVVGGGASNPIACRIMNCMMDTESIGVTPYGNFPYLAKILLSSGSFTHIHNNDLSISTAIPLVTVQAAADSTTIKGNRLNSTAPVSGRISNASTSTITADNFPEAPTVAVGSFTRNLAASSGSVAITGLGFMPKSIEFSAAVDAAVERCIGFAGVGSGLQQRCLHTDAAGANLSSAHAVRMIRTSAGNEQQAVLASMDLDGFTLSWTKVGSPPANDMVVNYIARR